MGVLPQREGHREEGKKENRGEFCSMESRSSCGADQSRAVADAGKKKHGIMIGRMIHRYNYTHHRLCVIFIIWDYFIIIVLNYCYPTVLLCIWYCFDVDPPRGCHPLLIFPFAAILPCLYLYTYLALFLYSPFSFISFPFSS